MTRLSMFRALAAGLALVLLPWLAAGQGTADFAGTWALDQARSELPERRRGDNPVAQRLVIAQTTDELSIIATIRDSYSLTGNTVANANAGEIELGSVYKLDGSEFPATAGGEVGGGRGTAKWDSGQLVVTITRQLFAGPRGFITEHSMETYRVDGNVLTLELTADPSQNTPPTKAVYVKTP